MKTPQKIEAYFRKIEAIRFENEHGGSYAYIQYLAYTRELLDLLRPYKRIGSQKDALEAITWLFNECLAFRFTHRNKSIFDEKMFETRSIFASVREGLEAMGSTQPAMSHEDGRIELHAQAA